MFAMVTTVILYVAGFVFLYGVIRLAVRHALEEMETRRVLVERAEEMAASRDRAMLRDNGFLTGN
ncbi:hypothetical protein [Micromonospora sp. KLBMP9576]|uniref:hypothetical protein n=1 Tax=Micromonospora sp. KLBMP9576 TaxID=3424769 RepID=UPI003D936E73